MDCRDVDRLMDAHLDRQLNAASVRELEAHLSECGRCGRRWVPLVQLLTDPQPVEVPAGLRDRILMAWDAQCLQPAAAPEARPLRYLRGIRYAAAIAACAAIFVSGWFLSTWWTGPQPGPIVVAVPKVQPAAAAVVVSPWIISSMARAAAMPVPVSPAVMLAGGVVPELAVTQSEPDERPPWIYEPSPSPADTRPADSTPDILPFPLRYLGA